MTAPPPPGQPARRRRLVVAAERAVVLGAVLLAVVALVRDGDRVGPAVQAMGPGRLALAGAAGLVGVRASAEVWRCCLAAVGAALPARPAVHLFAVTQLGKYLPGAAWPYVAQVREARRRGVDPARTVSGQLVFLALHVATGAVVAGVAVPLSGDGWAAPGGAWLLVVAAAALVCLLPPVLGRLLALVGRRPAELVPRLLARAALWMAATWLAYGVAVALLVGQGGARALLTATGAFALAWTAGFLVVLAPAGAGARELVLTAALAATVLDRPAALAVALVSRALLTAADLALPLLTAPRLLGRVRAPRPGAA